MKIVFYIIGCLSFSSCWYPFPNSKERSMQAGRFHPDINTHIDEKVNIDGYYVKAIGTTGSTLEPFILYKDATFGEIYFKNNDSVREQRRANTDLMTQIQHSKHGFNGFGGYYRMKGDTIEVDLYWDYMLRGVLVKRFFKVLDKNHLLLFQQIWVSPDEADEPDSCRILYDFIPAHNLPPSSSFRNKLRRYLWENKKDWKAYKRKIKEMRRGNKG